MHMQTRQTDGPRAARRTRPVPARTAPGPRPAHRSDEGMS
jgi:hypothetical protein